MINKKSKFTIETTLGKNEGIAFSVIPILALILLIFLYFHNPIGNSLFPKCIFLKFTGFYCPGCGATRATYYLLHGNILKAFSYNQLYVLFLPFMVYLYILNLGIKINGKDLIKVPRFNSIFYIFIGSIIIVFCILRNIHYYPFNLLAP
jgi:hypothetical protein